MAAAAQYAWSTSVMTRREKKLAWKRQNRAMRKAKLIALLGGSCEECSSTDKMEIDHKRPEDKGFKLSGGNLDKPWPELVAEAYKCQVLCHHHHVLKNRRDPKKYRSCKPCGRTYRANGWGLHCYHKHPEMLQKRKKAPVGPA